MVKPKITFFMPVHHAKEFLKSVHNEALFSHLISRTLMEVRSMNFKAKNLRMAFFYSEYLYVSMVEPAHESPARWLVYWRSPIVDLIPRRAQSWKRLQKSPDLWYFFDNGDDRKFSCHTVSFKKYGPP